MSIVLSSLALSVCHFDNPTLLNTMVSPKIRIVRINKASAATARNDRRYFVLQSCSFLQMAAMFRLVSVKFAPVLWIDVLSPGIRQMKSTFSCNLKFIVGVQVHCMNDIIDKSHPPYPQSDWLSDAFTS